MRYVNRTCPGAVQLPVAGQFRRVEMLGEPGLPDSVTISSRAAIPATFPYPAPDQDPLTRPNHDGPLHWLPNGVIMGGVGASSSGLTARPQRCLRGSIAWADIPVGGVSATVTRNALSRTVTINGMGRVHIIRP